ncbi:MAG: CHC2 zinc finger domain-containing protein [Lacunisphaera sp.]
MSKSSSSDLTPGGGKRPDFDEIKRTTDLVAVIEAHGVALKKEGRDYVGLCPFHDDKKPSLRVTPGKGLFRCMSCGAAGNVIQFVAKKKGIEEKEAALRLLSALPGVQRGTRLEEKKSSLPAVPPNVAADLLARVAGFYQRTLHKDRAGLDYLTARKLADAAMLETFRVGYCNGTLKTALPKSGEIIAHLQALGVLNAKGNEVFYGRVTVPILDEAGAVVGLYGRKVEGVGSRGKLPEDSARHIYLAGGHHAAFNAGAAKHAPRLVFTEAIFDALALWQAGERGVVPLYGADGFTEHHAALVREMSAREILLALDNDEKGRSGTAALREKLAVLAPSVPVRTVAWPEGAKDANVFFSSRENAAEAWAALVAPESGKTAGEEKMSPDAPQETPMAQGFALVWPTRRYEVVVLVKSSATRLKATVKAIGAEPGRFHVESLDLYSSRARRLFAAEAARVFRVPVETTENDLARLLVAAERRQEQMGSGAEAPVPSAQDRSEGIKLGRSPDLAGAITRDLMKLGIVGEERNGLVLYLVMTSRKLDDPLAAQILSPSGSGKSHLQDAVLSLCPEEDLIKLTSLSGQALFYKGEDSLRHKALALEEVAGAEGARYALRNLISAKKLTIETTVKNPATGRMETQVNTVHGPTAVFETTTQPDTDPETKSRYLLLSIDESPEQTRLIAEAQRHRHTLDAMIARKDREAVRRRHHAFQRLLRPLCVVNPYEPLLGYGDERLTTRRDQPKYLNLILAVAFLHQLQRPVKTHPVLGDYIEATLDDIAIANDLAAELFGASLDDLSPPGRRLAEQLAGYVEEQAKAHEGKWSKVDFGRRELREALKWSDTRLRVHLGELLRLEYLAPLCGANGSAFRYRLLVPPEVLRGGGGFVPGMRSVEELRKAVNLAGQTHHLAAPKPDLAGRNGHPAGTSPPQNGEVGNGVFPSENGYRRGDLAALNGSYIPVNGNGRHR